MGLAKCGPQYVICQTVVQHTIGHPKTLLTELINKCINYTHEAEPITAVSLDEYTLDLQLNSHSAPITPTPPPNLCSSEPHPSAVAPSTAAPNGLRAASSTLDTSSGYIKGTGKQPHFQTNVLRHKSGGN